MPAPAPSAEPLLPPAPAIAAIRLPELSAAERVRNELAGIAFRELRGATLAAAAAAVALAILVNLEAPSVEIWVWLAVMIAICVARMQLAQTFPMSAIPADRLGFWERRYVTATTVTALGWGVSIWLFPTFTGSARLGVSHALILAALLAGAGPLLVALRHGGLLYLAGILVPLAARFFAAGDTYGVVLGSGAIVLLVSMAATTLRNRRTLSDAIAARIQREIQVAELKLAAAGRESRESDLREARAHAESANRAKGEFLATISHEIRTPMNGVLGMLRILRETSLSPDQRDYLKTASDCAEKLLILLNDVLDFSKIDAGRLELHYAPFPPTAAASAVADLVHARARDKGLQFDLQIGDNLPSAILGDAARLRQILGNLIGNAIKFTERGRVTLAVTCAERTAERAVLHFTVTDTGIGIDSATLERLFKPFTQADTGMNRRYGGAGLGLAISTRLAQAMGGILQVQSTLNQGTTFRLILPCPLPDGAGVPPAPAHDEVPPLAASALKARVLVVEDDPINQQVIELFLKKLHLSALLVPDGETAVARATTETFDLILMDCHLPDIDGMEATRVIRQKMIGGRPIKIVALTANAGRKAREDCLAAGMDDFLTKPVRFEVLAETLRRNLPQN